MCRVHTLLECLGAIHRSQTLSCAHLAMQNMHLLWECLARFRVNSVSAHVLCELSVALQDDMCCVLQRHNEPCTMAPRTDTYNVWIFHTESHTPECVLYVTGCRVRCIASAQVGGVMHFIYNKPIVHGHKGTLRNISLISRHLCLDLFLHVEIYEYLYPLVDTYGSEKLTVC